MRPRLIPRRNQGWLMGAPCVWCKREVPSPLDGRPDVVDSEEAGGLVCRNREACDRARVRHLRRVDRKQRGVNQTRVRVGRWAA